METSPTTSPGTAPAGSGTKGPWLVPCDSGACVKIRYNGDGTVDLGSTRHENTVSFDMDEWFNFTRGMDLADANYQ